MKLNYQILKGILQWAETLEADGDFLVVGERGPKTGYDEKEVLDHARLMIVSGWLDGNSENLNKITVRGLTIKGHSLLRNEDVEQKLWEMPRRSLY